MEEYVPILYYTFDKKVLHPDEVRNSSTFFVDKLIGKLVSYKADVYFISFVNANDININSDLLKSPDVPYELINENQIESCMKKQPFDLTESDLLWSKNNMISKEFYGVILNDIIKFRRDTKISNILE